ncbi:hypothetical protein Ahy_A10g050394 isoform A [Arachis hypogaea]|uniref:Uncharacterized protein n=1 Tax=Arachis hypogaea TaxID=3818 RepID=A0A445B984_ARAHY|nr:hypothetical protein Ahy_A10g050394 isoform A [Arachis hypogaea]
MPGFENMPRKPWYSCILDAGTTDNTQHINVQTSRKNISFRRPQTKHVVEPTQISSDDEDYDPEADEVDSWDDHVDNLYDEEEAVCRNKSNDSKDTDYWSVVVSDDNVTRTMKLSVMEAMVLPPELQAIGQAAGLLSEFLGSFGADFQHFPINEES